jgi:hypothetical protein
VKTYFNAHLGATLLLTWVAGCSVAGKKKKVNFYVNYNIHFSLLSGKEP